jgi:hypothetical protein
MRIVFALGCQWQRKSSKNRRRNMSNVVQQSGRTRKPTLSFRREAASFNAALEPTPTAP